MDQAFTRFLPDHSTWLVCVRWQLGVDFFCWKLEYTFTFAIPVVIMLLFNVPALKSTLLDVDVLCVRF